MKTKEELNALKVEVETVSKKLNEINDEELEQVSGGISFQTTGPNETCRHHYLIPGNDDICKICATCTHFRSPNKCNYVGPY